MARSDLVLNLVKNGIRGDIPRFKMTVEAIAADASARHHHSFAERVRTLLSEADSFGPDFSGSPSFLDSSDANARNVFFELRAEKTIDDLVLPDDLREQCTELFEEHARKDLLRSYGVEPRHKILLFGAPGNGKTSLAEAIANHLMLPFYVVSYEGIFSKYLGETAQKLDALFDLVRSRRCVLFFDEFDAIGKEREDENDNGEAKRVVNALLKQIDNLPSHVVVIAATNHQSMLDKAMWRRFQIQLSIPKPDQKMAEQWLSLFQQRTIQDMGVPLAEIANVMSGFSFAELESFALEVRRKFILSLPMSERNVSEITMKVLERWKNKYKPQ
ncbi:ATP-binding protein [Rheinheimera sp. F8]|uniref:AAA family ATPase n=1 Tax=Rheinheimera sp. F8 TaxID=1763998 RepID=UPI000744B26B|nr:ATP-binding protein [Rheinheimera sp. F8]ALZ75686.1 AAA family ATPase [Rheinheimera sp. F8]